MNNVIRFLYKAIVVGCMIFMSKLYKWITFVLLKLNGIKIRSIDLYRIKLVGISDPVIA